VKQNDVEFTLIGLYTFIIMKCIEDLEDGALAVVFKVYVVLYTQYCCRPIQRIMALAMRSFLTLNPHDSSI
jgi:hypothetical protein